MHRSEVMPGIGGGIGWRLGWVGGALDVGYFEMSKVERRCINATD